MYDEARGSLNLLELMPRQNVQSETADDGTVTLLVPKFRSPFILRWFVPLLAKPYIRLKLDKFGSYIWSCCDGNTTVSDIAMKMGQQFGEETESLYDRIGVFIRRLDESESLVIRRSEK